MTRITVHFARIGVHPAEIAVHVTRIFLNALIVPAISIHFIPRRYIPNKRIAMRKICEILRLRFEVGSSFRQISQCADVSTGASRPQTRSRNVQMKNWQKFRPMLLSVLAVGSSNSYDNYSSSSTTVKPAAFPPLLQQVRQNPILQECLPSCLANLTERRASMQKRLMNAM